MQQKLGNGNHQPDCGGMRNDPLQGAISACRLRQVSLQGLPRLTAPMASAVPTPVQSRAPTFRTYLVRRLAGLRSFASHNTALSARLALLVLAGVLPLLMFNLAMIYVGFRDDRAGAMNQTLVLSRAVARSVEGFLSTSRADLMELAESRSLVAGDLVTLSRQGREGPGGSSSRGMSWCFRVSRWSAVDRHKRRVTRPSVGRSPAT